MIRFNDSTLPEIFREYLNKTGYLTMDGAQETSRLLEKYPGQIRLSEKYIAESGGLFKAVSRKSAQILRNDIQHLSTRDLASEYRDQWQYILMHMQPHLDEYLASLMLRSCLPDDMYALTLGETALYSRYDDPQAKLIWPHAALLGVGNTVNGGAQAMLVFDEHELAGDQKTHPSLVMLMKRYLFGSRQVSPALYDMLREVNYIDQYGDVNPKSLSTYTKHLQTVPLPSAGGAYLTPEWKCAILDACLIVFYLALRSSDVRYRSRMSWEPFIQLSLEDFKARTPLREEKDFDKFYRKMKNYLIDQFAYRTSCGELKYNIPSPNHPNKSTEAELTMLVPYLPKLCFQYWGGILSQILLFPLWECRLFREILTTRCYRDLCKNIPSNTTESFSKKIETGTITVVCCKPQAGNESPIRIFDFAADKEACFPSPLNQYIKCNANGLGFGIFRNSQYKSIVLTKGSGIKPQLWKRVCDRLIAEEGQSDDPQSCGAWHITQNSLGIAPFLLNGNATHRYTVISKITAVSLARIVETCQAAEE